MSLEETLSSWTGPSSPTEQEKQERTERMVCDAINEHAPFSGCELKVYAKGSYANNTNVKAESDVDVAVQCTEAVYWEEAEPGLRPSMPKYSGSWSPEKLRAELVLALAKKFPGQVDASGSVAIQVNSSTARVDADVVPCFSFEYQLVAGTVRAGTKIFRRDGGAIVNYPQQQLENGRAKNNRTNYAFKKTVRVLKRMGVVMAAEEVFPELPSYFIECLAYNCPDSIYFGASWADVVKATLAHIWTSLEGDEPDQANSRWIEVNEFYYLFHSGQKWTRTDGRGFAAAAWSHFSLGS